MKNAKHLKTRKCFTNVGSSKMDSMYRVTVQRNEDEGLKKRQLQMPGNSFTLFVQQKGREDIELKFYSPEEEQKVKADLYNKFISWKEEHEEENWTDFGMFEINKLMKYRKRDLITLTEYKLRTNSIEIHVLGLHETREGGQ